MPTTISQSLSFDTGLETIVTTEDVEAPQLPQMTALPPSEEAMDAQLPQLLQTPTFDSRILSALRPFIRNRDILGPSRYQTLADESPDALDAAADALPDGEAKDALHDAAKLLRDEKSLRDLLLLYRHTLHKA